MSKNRDALRRLETLLKEASYTKKVLETLGKAATDTLVNKLMSDENFDLKGFFETQKKIHESERLERRIHRLCEKKTGGSFQGETVDAFSAFMISKVLKNLTNEQKSHLLSRPIKEIIAISYKLAARTEF
jgi:pyridoxal/pyridoxine/pyridoxamine kinase